MADGQGQKMDGSANVFGAIAELAKDVGRVEAQAQGFVTYERLMNHSTENRKEITSKLDKSDEHQTENVRQLGNAIQAKMDALATQILALTNQVSVMQQAAVAQQSAVQQNAVAQQAVTQAVQQVAPEVRKGGRGVVLGSITATIGASLAVGVVVALKLLGVSI